MMADYLDPLAIHVVMNEVPPPKEVPVQEQAHQLGLCAGLRVEERAHGQWRCGQCGKMQPANSWQVWVPDSVRKGDPDWSISEAARLNAYNGESSAWCLDCAPKQSKKAADITTTKIRCSFRSENQLAWFMVRKEYYVLGEVVYAKVLFEI
jgi:hypothetical protein